jgi:hypothetical protein
MFNKGDRVSTPHGKGTVNYRRMAPPDFYEVDAYSVVMDVKVSAYDSPLLYSATIYPASQVWRIDDQQAETD